MEIYDSYDGVCLKTAMFDGADGTAYHGEISPRAWDPEAEKRTGWTNAGLEEPKTMEDIYNILEQFPWYRRIPGGNGEGQDSGPCNRSGDSRRVRRKLYGQQYLHLCMGHFRSSGLMTEAAMPSTAPCSLK